MIIILDVGNTTSKIGYFKDDEIVKTFIIEYQKDKNNKIDLDKFGCTLKDTLTSNKFDVDDVFIGSVVPSLNKTFEDVVLELFNKKPLFFNNSLKIDLKFKIDDPSSVGADLIADLIEGKAKYRYPLLIIDAGTVNKYLIIDKDGYFSGCLFTCGFDASFKAMSSSTELLPEIKEQGIARKNFGKNTLEAMKLGVIHSFWTLFERITRDLDDYEVVVTGGNFKNYLFLDDKIEKYKFDEHLALKGLYKIYKSNYLK